MKSWLLKFGLWQPGASEGTAGYCGPRGPHSQREPWGARSHLRTGWRRRAGLALPCAAQAMARGESSHRERGREVQFMGEAGLFIVFSVQPDARQTRGLSKRGGKALSRMN